MKIESPVAEALDQQNIPYRLFTHTNKVTSLEQAAEERGQTPEQVVRSLLFRLAEDEFVMVLVAGAQQVPWKTLRRYLGQSRVTMATQEELLAQTGYQIGAVSPIGLPRPLRILVDATVTAQEEISIGSGVRGTTVIMKTAVLLTILPFAEQVNLFNF